jgi:phosphatidylglycerol:prolipoprotein diacylglycerol transferase
VAGSFLFFYGTIRLVIENFRQPDSHLGFIFSDSLTMGQLLCIPMILIGLIFIITFKNKNEIIS